jgi:exodeoxyribonuclease III
VRVATFNINNINKRLDNLLSWLAKTEPDVASLQQLKAEQGEFPEKAPHCPCCQTPGERRAHCVGR